ncbi:hypothetical protein B0H17DRAFT_1173537 [Mycena rosella]|uniref:Uncharacterized protein n=1 Tax=Mycena rosella TaxID=1033263 RepID=A0AAD7MCV7_MYCRO|nr:hypothetical protein B0H17DRAFT_1173537 [Mycena rosella]
MWWNGLLPPLSAVPHPLSCPRQRPLLVNGRIQAPKVHPVDKTRRTMTKIVPIHGSDAEIGGPLLLGNTWGDRSDGASLQMVKVKSSEDFLKSYSWFANARSMTQPPSHQCASVLRQRTSVLAVGCYFSQIRKIMQAGSGGGGTQPSAPQARCEDCRTIAIADLPIGVAELSRVFVFVSRPIDQRTAASNQLLCALHIPSLTDSPKLASRTSSEMSTAEPYIYTPDPPAYHTALGTPANAWDVVCVWLVVGSPFDQKYTIIPKNIEPLNGQRDMVGNASV